MNKTFSLTLQQVDTINLSLAKAIAVAQMVAECGGKHRLVPDGPPPASLFVVMQVVVEELEKVVDVIKRVEQEE